MRKLKGMKKAFIKASKFNQDPRKKPAYTHQQKNENSILNFHIFEFIFLALVLVFIAVMVLTVYYLSNISTAMSICKRLPQQMYDLNRLMELILISNNTLHIRMTTLENHIILLTQVVADSNSIECLVLKHGMAICLFGASYSFTFVMFTKVVTPVLLSFFGLK